MSDYRLNTHVHAVEVDATGARTGRDATFGPDDDLNAPDKAWALKAISNPDVWAGDTPPTQFPAPVVPPASAEAGEVEKLRARIAELESAQQGTPAGVLKPPPRSGPGSGAAEWRSYAAAVGVDVPTDADRPAVIAVLDESGKPTK